MSYATPNYYPKLKLDQVDNANSTFIFLINQGCQISPIGQGGPGDQVCQCNPGGPGGPGAPGG